MRVQRTALVKGFVLPFCGMPVTVEAEVGRGSNAVVYRGSYPDETTRQPHAVIVKELYPAHAGIRRGEDGRIVCTDEGGEKAMAAHRASFEAGNRTHVDLQLKHPNFSSLNINTFAENGTLYTVLGFSGGKSLEETFASESPDLCKTAQRMLGVLDALEIFHESGLLHLDVAPDNILIIGQEKREQVVLIDFNSVQPMDVRQRDSYRSLKPGYQSPEVLLGSMSSIGAASDLYSVAAVFYRCLAGRPLDEFDQIFQPQFDRLPCLKNQPETVRAHVCQILTQGLSSVPEERCQSVAEMRRAFEELIERIRGVGVTHWALWEAGRRMVDSTIRFNPALSYLKNPRTLYPSRVENGETAEPLEAFMARFVSAEGQSLLLTAPGGMGKTTALLRAVAAQQEPYIADRPAMLYLSLYGCRGDQPHQIRDALLSQLHFPKPSHEDAAHRLHELMSKPLANGRPAVCLLIDGLNEVPGPIDGLTNEINALSRLDGVRLLVASRSAEGALSLPRASLAPLTSQDVRDALGQKGLLPPQSDDMQRLLQTPMMLSIFIASAQTQQQFSVSTQKELLDAYFAALLDKEMLETPDELERRYQVEAALKWVLPAIARAMHHAKGALGNEGLSPAVSRCYRLLDSPALRRAFSQWIGHGSAIRCGAKNADDWYGLMVHGLLWKRMGLLIRDEEERYHIPHQILLEYLLDVDADNQRRMRRRPVIRRCANPKEWLPRGAAALLVPLALIWGLSRGAPVQPYNEPMAKQLFGYMMESSGLNSRQAAFVKKLLTDLTDDSILLFAEYEEIKAAELARLKEADPVQRSTKLLSDMVQKGGRLMPWSRRPLEEELCKELLTFASGRWEEYEPLLEALRFVLAEERRDSAQTAEYLRTFSRVAELDEQIALVLSSIVCDPHLVGPYDVYGKGPFTRDNLWQSQQLRNTLNEAKRGFRQMQDERSLQMSILSDLLWEDPAYTRFLQNQTH